MAETHTTSAASTEEEEEEEEERVTQEESQVSICEFSIQAKLLTCPHGSSQHQCPPMSFQGGVSRVAGGPDGEHRGGNNPPAGG